jgi:hypothetical protein
MMTMMMMMMVVTTMLRLGNVALGALTLLETRVVSSKAVGSRDIIVYGCALSS